MSKVKVSLAGCSSYKQQDVSVALRKGMDLIGGIDRFISRGDRVLLKPNILIGKPPEFCVNTHPAIIEAVIVLVKEAGGIPVLGDSPGFGSTLRNAKRAGYNEICQKYRVPVIEFNNPAEYSFEKGLLFKKLWVERSVMECDKVINLAKLKTHGMMMLTLAVKNMFGAVCGYKKLHWHMVAKDDYNVFAGFLTDLYRFISPCLNILDGIDSMEGNGPQSGKRRFTGFIALSSDGIALDRVICDAVGYKPMDVPVMDYSIRNKIESADIKNINVLGKSVEEIKIKDFLPPRKNRLTFYRMPAFMHRIMDRFILVLPRVSHDKCTRCGICYRTCPNKAIDYKENSNRKYKKSVVINYERCIRCYCCQEMCPEGAIRLR